MHAGSTRKKGVLAATLLLSVVLAACSRDGRTLAPASPEQNESIAIAPTDTAASLEPSESFAVTGPWTEGGDIDLAFTCYGRSVSPPLEISGQPSGTTTLAVLLHDVETPDVLLWTMANVAGGTVAIGEGATPPDVVVATNSDGNLGYQQIGRAHV